MDTRIADTAAAAPWVIWLWAHIAQVNSILQAICLIVGIVSGICAIVYHTRKRGP